MSKKSLFLILALCTAVMLHAGDGDYAVSKISPALLKGANAVKRMENISFEILNTGEAVLRRKYAITIINDNADRLAAFAEQYDKLHSIKNIEGTLYDAMGRELKRLKNKQILDFSGTDDNNLADDNRAKVHHFYHKDYPYTVEYEVEIKYNGTLFFPVWFPVEQENFSVEQSSFEVISPADYTVRYKAFNYPGEPVSTDLGKGRRSLSWKASQLTAVAKEYAEPTWYEITMAVFTGPTDFEIEKYKGKMADWKQFGDFVFALKQGRDQLPDNVKQVVRQVTAAEPDIRSRITRLYEYLQKNTRYISIQLGIGGWQPFDATYVANKAYGDCKALTNFMYSLLKEAGITSYYTLIKAGRGRGKIITDFPSQQFNHVILCVPLTKDTMWLECTSQTIPAGYLGDFTCDRNALLITEEGGKMVRTPKYGINENLEIRNIKAVLDDEATLKIQAATKYTGLQQDDYHSLINQLSKDKVKEVLHERLDFGTYDISNFEYKETKSSLPVIEEKLDIEVSNYATITGKRLFIVPNVMTRTGRKLSADEDRKYDLELTFEYRDIDTVEISIPSGYLPEATPKDVSLNSKFGHYESRVKLNGDKLYYYRKMEHYSGRFPASDYADLVKFYETIYKADRSKVVLVKNQ